MHTKGTTYMICALTVVQETITTSTVESSCVWHVSLEEEAHEKRWSSDPWHLKDVSMYLL